MPDNPCFCMKWIMFEVAFQGKASVNLEPNMLVFMKI